MLEMDYVQLYDPAQRASEWNRQMSFSISLNDSTDWTNRRNGETPPPGLGFSIAKWTIDVSLRHDPGCIPIAKSTRIFSDSRCVSKKEVVDNSCVIFLHFCDILALAGMHIYIRHQ